MSSVLNPRSQPTSGASPAEQRAPRGRRQASSWSIAGLVVLVPVMGGTAIAQVNYNLAAEFWAQPASWTVSPHLWLAFTVESLAAVTLSIAGVCVERRALRRVSISAWLGLVLGVIYLQACMRTLAAL